MIEFDRVSKRYDSGRDALRELSLFVEPEELVFLTGHSGAGKSTLLKLIMIMERQTRGRVIVNGKDLQSIKGGGIAKHRQDIGVVFQDHQLLYDRSVFDNVALPLLISGFEHRDIGRRVRAALDKVGLLDKEKSNPEALSGGEQQRVGIARAVASRPKILLADEPTGNLDPALSAEIMALFRAFSRAGVTVLIATHDLALISRMQHRILTLKDGALVTGGGRE
ncbi:MAG: cell division ATP-binding protein FtsE [Aequoribacter sp.]|uniref:cell division ATP-binding protein FtsE n=1 Tax=Aequoribacter sp. TaxID=2847771 RepID=UPI003C4EA38C